MEHTQDNVRGKTAFIFHRLVFFLREYFFPSSGCAVCGASLIGRTECWYGLCENCRKRLDGILADSQPRCDLCGRPLVSEQVRCLSCRENEAPAFNRVIALFPYSGSLRKLLQSYKFGKNLAAGNYLAEQAAAALERLPLSATDCALVPVPPRPGKIRKTGWDQIEYLAGLLETGGANTRKFPVSRCLKRLASGVQKELNRTDRKSNLQGRIVSAKKPAATVVVIDDVVTTGSTMDVCAATLKAGGAEAVYGICLFYD